MSRKTKKLMWSVPLVAVFAVVGALAAFIALAPSEALAQDNVLGPPRDVTATKDGQGVIELSWTPPSTSAEDVTGYRIDMSDDGKAWKAEESNTGSTDTVYDDGSLMPGTMKYYRVFAIYGTMGEGEPSEVVSATTDPAMVPGKPTGLTLAGGTPSDVSGFLLTWAAPSSDGGSAITGYKIERLKDGETTWMTVKADTGLTNTITVDCAACPYQDTGLSQATEYDYRVSAINKVGTGMPSESESSTTAASTTGPDAPTGLTAQGSNSQVTLRWLAPSDPDGDPITGYIVERSRDSTDLTTYPWETIANTGTPTSQVVGGAFSTGTTPWHYRVTAKNKGGGNGLPTAALTVGPPDATTHPAVTSLRVVPKKPLTIQVDWRAGTTGARIDYSTDGLVWKELVDDTTTFTINDATQRYTHPDDELKVGEKRYYRVIAVTGGTLHQESEVKSGTAGDPNKPGKPTALDLTTTPATADTITLAWTAPTETGGSPITGYKIERSKDNSAWMTLKADTGMVETTYVDEDLTAKTKYYYRVSAINAGGPGDPSDSASETTAVAVAPGIPSGLVAVARGMSRIDLYWLAPDDSDGAPITGYKVDVSVDDGNSWTEVEDNTNSRTTMFSDTVTGEATRIYRVSAINSVGVSAPSGTDTAMAGADTQPTMLGPATGVSASPGTTAGTAEVTWTPGPAATMHWIYAIRADEGEGGYTFMQASSNSSHTLTGLDSGVEYIVGISAGKGQLPGGEWSDWMFTRVTPN